MSVSELLTGILGCNAPLSLTADGQPAILVCNSLHSNSPSQDSLMRKFTFQVRFTKEGRARFISHRELMTIIERAVRRAEIPIAISEGFNPRPRISFLTALPIGITSDDEIIYIHLAEWISPAELQRRLNLQLTELFNCDISDAINRIQPIAVKNVNPVHSGSLPSTFYVEYEIMFQSNRTKLPGLRQQLTVLLDRTEIIVTRQHPSGTKTINIRPYIKDINIIKDKNILISTIITPQGTVRPEEIIESLGLDGSINEGSVNIRKTKTVISL